MDSLLVVDPSQRWRVITKSILYTFGVALFALFLDLPIAAVSLAAATAALITYFAQMMKLAGDKPTNRRDASLDASRFTLSLISYGVIACFIIVVSFFPGKVVDAAVIKWRIEALEKPLSDGGDRTKPPLAALASALARAHNERRQIRPEMQEEIRDSLASAAKADLPGYLPAASAFINYRSSDSEPTIPDCLQTEPEHLVWTPLSPDAHGSRPPPDQIRFTDCRLILDSSDFAYQFQPKTQTDAVSIVCEECQVIYSGGELPIAKSKGFVNLIFTDSTFKVHLHDDSPSEAKGLVSAILTSTNVNHVHYIAAGVDVWSGRRVVDGGWIAMNSR